LSCQDGTGTLSRGAWRKRSSGSRRRQRRVERARTRHHLKSASAKRVRSPFDSPDLVSRSNSGGRPILYTAPCLNAHFMRLSQKQQQQMLLQTRPRMTSDLEESRSSSGMGAWLRGPLPDVSLLLIPAAQVLPQANIDVDHAAPLTAKEAWRTPGGAPSVGFRLRHIAGRLFRVAEHAQRHAGQIVTTARIVRAFVIREESRS
jgi:hypothetical protein